MFSEDNSPKQAKQQEKEDWISDAIFRQEIHKLAPVFTTPFHSNKSSAKSKVKTPKRKRLDSENNNQAEIRDRTPSGQNLKGRVNNIKTIFSTSNAGFVNPFEFSSHKQLSSQSVKDRQNTVQTCELQPDSAMHNRKHDEEEDQGRGENVQSQEKTSNGEEVISNDVTTDFGHQMERKLHYSREHHYKRLRHDQEGLHVFEVETSSCQTHPMCMEHPH